MANILDSKRRTANEKESYEACKAEYLRLLNSAKYANENKDRKYYKNIIHTLMQGEQRAKSGNKRTATQHLFYLKYEIKQDSKGNTYLIKKREKPNDPIVKCVPVEDSFDLLFRIHVDNNHPGREEMRRIVKQKYIISTQCVDFFTSTCKSCKKSVKKSPQVKTVLDPKPIQTISMKKKVVMLDILHFTHKKDGNFKFLLIYLELSTSYIILRPLIARCSFEIATELFKIITSFGLPEKYVVRHEDLQFYKLVADDLKKLGVKCVIPLAGSVDSLPSMDFLKEKLSAWEKKTGTNNWAIGSHVVQWELNNRLYEGVPSTSGEDLKTPYLRVFGSSPLTYEKILNLMKEVNEGVYDGVDGIYKNVSEINIDMFTEIIPQINDVCPQPMDESELRVKQAEGDISNENDNENVSKMNNLYTNCHICETKIVNAHLCNTCNKPVHMFCCEVVCGGTEKNTICVCFSCSKIKRRKT